MRRVFTTFLLISLIIFAKSKVFAEVNTNQLIEYIAKESHLNYNDFKKEEKLSVFKSIETAFKTNTLSQQQKLDAYCILLLDIGLTKPEAAKFKALILYEIELYDFAHPQLPLYLQSRTAFIDFINTKGEDLITKKVGIVKDERDLQLEKMGAYSKKKEISPAARTKAVEDIYQDYLSAGVKLESYRMASLKSFN